MICDMFSAFGIVSLRNLLITLFSSRARMCVRRHQNRNERFVSISTPYLVYVLLSVKINMFFYWLSNGGITTKRCVSENFTQLINIWIRITIFCGDLHFSYGAKICGLRQSFLRSKTIFKRKHFMRYFVRVSFQLFSVDEKRKWQISCR